MVSYLHTPKDIYHLSGYAIQDLETHDGRFPLEAASWHVYRSTTQWDASTEIIVSPLYSRCDSFYLMGGYEPFQFIKGQEGPVQSPFIRTFIDLPAHQMFFFKVQIWNIDAYNPSLYFGIFSISFDSGTYQQICYNELSSPSQCGISSRSDSTLTVLGRRQHSASSLMVKVTPSGSMYYNNLSFGLRALSITLMTTSQGSDTMCLRTDSLITDQCGTSYCSCPQGQFLNQLNQCSDCHSSCEECFGPTSLDCYTCSPASRTSYNGLQCVACSQNCAKCSNLVPNKCLTCNEGYLLSFDSTCIAAKQCNYKLAQMSLPNPLYETLCDSAKLLYWHISCQTLCASYTPLWPSLIDFATQQCSSCDNIMSSGWSSSCSSVCKALFTTTENIAADSSNLCKGNPSFFLNASYEVRLQPLSNQTSTSKFGLGGY